MKGIGWLTAGVISLILLNAKKAKANPMEISYLGQSNLPRGMRNNNPGNIEKSPSAWLGKISHSQNTDPRFEQFVNYAFGIRAMIRLIRDTYIKRDGLDTIPAIINKYAPSFENPVEAYVTTVERQYGLSRNQKLGTDKATMRKLIKAMAHMENGRPAITDDQFNQAWILSLS